MFAVVHICNGIIIQILDEQSVSAQAPGILSTELLIFKFMAGGGQNGLYVQLQKFI